MAYERYCSACGINVRCREELREIAPPDKYGSRCSAQNVTARSGRSLRDCTKSGLGSEGGSFRSSN